MLRQGLSTDTQAHVGHISYRVPEKEASPRHVHAGRAPCLPNARTYMAANLFPIHGSVWRLRLNQKTLRVASARQTLPPTGDARIRPV